jgi:hypothetical protein
MSDFYAPPPVDAKIIARGIKNPLGDDFTEAFDFKWEGGSIGIVDYGMRRWAGITGTPKIGDVISIGALRLRVIDDNIRLRRLYVMKDGWKSILYYWYYKALTPLIIIYHRLIFTALIWGLADYFDEARVPSWRDLKIARRFRK